MHVEPVRYFSPRVSATRRVGSSQLDNVNVAGVGARVYRIRFAWDRVRAVKVSEGRREAGAPTITSICPTTLPLLVDYHV